MTQTSAFHFESLVWDWPIAIYLFLIGISAGLVTLAVLLRRFYPQAGGADSTLLRTTLIVGPGAVILGLLILVFHLTRPWTFWKLMFHYSFTSVMSMGVMLFQLYMVVLVLWLAKIFEHDLLALQQRWLPKLGIVQKVLSLLTPVHRGLETLMLVLAVSLLNLCLGAEKVPLVQVLRALVGQGSGTTAFRIVRYVRLPRLCACLLAAGLSGCSSVAIWPLSAACETTRYSFGMMAATGWPSSFSSSRRFCSVHGETRVKMTLARSSASSQSWKIWSARRMWSISKAPLIIAQRYVTLEFSAAAIDVGLKPGGTSMSR